MKLFSADATMFLKKNIFWHQKVEKKHPQKLLRNTQFFFTLSCPNGPNSRILFENVPYRPTVTVTGVEICSEHSCCEILSLFQEIWKISRENKEKNKITILHWIRFQPTVVLKRCGGHKKPALNCRSLIYAG